ncbi:MAG: hypothetical protein OES09_18280 [Gammaproteobacteria bacterium]|nr:hypothetical protein [Gammaproteobacteria bacterium]
MAFCDSFKECANLDGRLVINRTLTAPSLANVGADLGFQLSNAKIPNVRLLPYAKAKFRQTWRAKEACLGPARTVIGLAPAEELVFEQRTAKQFDFSSVITRNQEFSSTYGYENRTETEDIQTSVDSTSTSTTDTDTVDLGPLGTWGSGGDADVTTIEEVIERTTRSLNEILVSVSSTQVNGLTTEVSSSTSVTTETALTRRIVNPMNDRTLELRFHPVFRTFEVETEFDSWVFGMIFRPKVLFDRDFVMSNRTFISRVIPMQTLAPETQFVEPGPLPAPPMYARAGADPTAAVVSDLNASGRRSARRFMLHTRNVEGASGLRRLATAALSAQNSLKATKSMPPEGAFALDRLQVLGNDMEVPARSVDLYKKAIALPKWQSALMDDLSSAQTLDHFRRTFSFKTEVKMFIGTHLEAIPGHCVLPVSESSIPEPEIE